MKFLALTIILFSLPLFSATRDNISMKDKMQIEGRELVLNGLGTRKATWLRVKVYVGGLYLEQKSQDYNKFLNDKTLKFIRMHFVRDVKKEKLVNAWNEAFAGSLSDKNAHKKQRERLNELMGNIKKNEKIEFTFFPDKVLLKFAQNKTQEIKGAGFSKALLAVWFINPLDEGLRKGLLGKN